MNIVSWMDVETCGARAAANSIWCPRGFKSADDGCADGDDAAAAGVGCVDGIRCCSWDLENFRIESLVLHGIIFDLQARDTGVKNYSNDSDATFTKRIPDVRCDGPCGARHLDASWKAGEECLVI